MTIALHVRASWTPAEQEKARDMDRITHSKLKALCKKNTTCADCGCRHPGWAALPHGSHVCIDCAQVHRKIGRHVSQVKAINTGTYLWHANELRAMELMGNARVALLYLGGAKTPPQKPATTDEDYIRDKYERRRWYNGALTMDELLRSGKDTVTPNCTERNDKAEGCGGEVESIQETGDEQGADPDLIDLSNDGDRKLVTDIADKRNAIMAMYGEASVPQLRASGSTGASLDFFAKYGL